MTSSYISPEAKLHHFILNETIQVTKTVRKNGKTKQKVVTQSAFPNRTMTIQQISEFYRKFPDTRGYFKGQFSKDGSTFGRDEVTEDLFYPFVWDKHVPGFGYIIARDKESPTTGDALIADKKEVVEEEDDDNDNGDDDNEEATDFDPAPLEDRRSLILAKIEREQLDTTITDPIRKSVGLPAGDVSIGLVSVCSDPTVPASLIPMKGTIPLRFHIFHDVENCPLSTRITPSFKDVYIGILLTALQSRISPEELNIYLADKDPVRDIMPTCNYHFVIDMDHKHSHFQRSEALTQLLVDADSFGVLMYKFPKPERKGDSDVDNKIKELIHSTIEVCRPYSQEEKDKTLFVLVAGDRDYKGDIRAIHRAGLDVVVIQQFVKTQKFKLDDLVGKDYIKYNWSEIVRGATTTTAAGV